MSIDLLKIAHCPSCGNVFQKNLRNLCADCSSEEDRLFQATERTMLRNRLFSNAEVAEAVSVPPEKIRSWIRSGKLRIADYPNLSDQCDLCKAPIRSGHLCLSCAGRIKGDIARMREQERLEKERLRAANAYISKR
ncbi:hypothetical protein GE107_01715 [Cohnella sp. CFH 77786]|uniref:hypothetical protein n=1 Tax=Cohnella sp. CFH 77786 TaxID=2662265 RepID=UPI001C608E5C|nr:hypothetical protein [Cohnella sp. CFH 77786]MBW5444780.1 hypothetical protein [Cohnella sp. CFH 77786]